MAKPLTRSTPTEKAPGTAGADGADVGVDVGAAGADAGADDNADGADDDVPRADAEAPTTDEGGTGLVDGAAGADTCESVRAGFSIPGHWKFEVCGAGVTGDLGSTRGVAPVVAPVAAGAVTGRKADRWGTRGASATSPVEAGASGSRGVNRPFGGVVARSSAFIRLLLLRADARRAGSQRT
jgi:hypothetical protein